MYLRIVLHVYDDGPACPSVDVVVDESVIISVAEQQGCGNDLCGQ